MSRIPVARLQKYVLFLLVLLVLAGCAHAAPAPTATPKTEPSVYLDFNEGSGSTALDASGHGNAATLAGPTRIESGGCGGALRFNGRGNYVAIPYTPLNHPAREITVSGWFYVDSFDSQTLISADNMGGYRLGFGDGGDLWWILNTEGSGEVAVPVQHEGITPRQWHHVTATYDGEAAKIYLDGILRNRVNATGPLRYAYANYVLLGADAGASTMPDPVCPRFFTGGLDEIRIYDTALEYSQVMDDRYLCSAEPGTVSLEAINVSSPVTSCGSESGTLSLQNGGEVTRTLVFGDKTENGTWHVTIPAGSKLSVSAQDRYSTAYPDAWYIEITDEHGRIDRSVAFPNTRNTPPEGVIPSGNATVYIRYFDGKYRFPASVDVTFRCIAPPPAPPMLPQNILANPGIVIYSASWATLIAVLVVVIWLHRRKSAERATESQAESEPEKSGKDE